jgi:hypothetical protein
MVILDGLKMPRVKLSKQGGSNVGGNLAKRTETGRFNSQDMYASPVVDTVLPKSLMK